MTRKGAVSPRQEAGLAFRENAMHGSVLMLKKYGPLCDVHEAEAVSKRTALHKAAFWGHVDAVKYLLNECKLRTDARDSAGDTPLHDAARFGHAEVVGLLLKAGADPSIKNNNGQTVLDVAVQYEYPDILKRAKI